MSTLSLPILKKDFDVTADHSDLAAFITLGISVVGLMVLGFLMIAVIFIGVSGFYIFILCIVGLFVSLYFLRKYIRRKMKDIPKQNDFTGFIFFHETSLNINGYEEKLEDISEMVLFYAGYQGESYGRNSERNGNGAIFIKDKTDKTYIYKINISNKKKLILLKNWQEQISETLPYLKSYETSDLGYILNDDLSNRRKFKNVAW